ncbi:MAG: hypothetical protein KDB62_06315 [Solirubrobacterales bacterium]|nr:hypothetical protein [Solirubrobacterales bacterium]
MKAEIELLPDPVRRGIAAEGPVQCAQSALLTVDGEALEQIWTPSTLELLARSYWRFLNRRTFGAVRVIYAPESRSVVLFSSRVPLLRFGAPRFSTGADAGVVEWPIEAGLLVARAGRRRGYLRIEVRRRDRPGTDAGDRGRTGPESVLITSEVANFYPWIRGSGPFARLGTWIYSQTQLRAHIWITRGFLRSLSGLTDEALSAGGVAGPDAGRT